MSDVHKRLGDTYKKEADDVLFANLQFDKRLRNRVLQKIAEDEKTQKTEMNPRPMTSIRTKNWMRVSAAAAVAVLVIVSAVIFYDGGQQPEPTLLYGDSDPDQAKTPELANQPESVNQPAPSPYDTEDGASDQAWDLLSPEQASAALGGIKVLPDYVPDGFSLVRLQGFGQTPDRLARVILMYASDTSRFSLTIERRPLTLGTRPYETVDINGTEGYLAAGETNELAWGHQELTYRITGQIAADEMLRIARSL